MIIETVILTLITINFPNAYKPQDIETRSIVLRSEREYDAMNICRRLGDQFVIHRPIELSKTQDRRISRAYTCDGGSQVEYWLEDSVEKKETK